VIPIKSTLPVPTLTVPVDEIFGAVISRSMLPEATVDSFPAASRNLTVTFLVPSPEIRFIHSVVPNGIHASAKIFEISPLIIMSVIGDASVALMVASTLKLLTLASQLLILMDGFVGPLVSL
jgi:hypothetical protein